MLPLYPMMVVLAGYGLVKLIDLIQSKVWRRVLVIAVLVVVASRAIGFASIYSQPHTRVQASEWMHENISTGSVIAVEHWDDRLPLSNSQKYQYEELELYNLPDVGLKWEKVDRQLARADYVVLASNRLYAPLQRLSDCELYKKCYPKTAMYYEALFAEKLGFVKVAEFTSYPKFLFGEIVDDEADESFTVYDHPKVIIFGKDKETTKTF